MQVAVYPGSFDPVTNGHLDIIKRSAKNFDKVVVVALNNTSKKPIFTIEERVEMLKEVTSELGNVEVDSFKGLLTDYLKENDIKLIVKGLRAISDFEAEFQMALMNRKLSDEVETFFMMTHSEYSYLSSSLVKEVFRLGGDITDFVPNIVIEKLNEKFGGEK
jgi:pantetheine-phosphate adenylyltransferase